MISTGVSGGSDPLTGALTQMLAVPLRELYAVLLRLDLIEIVD
ncbi:Rv1535 domain-containing protein [Nocardia sp. NPDC004123]